MPGIMKEAKLKAIMDIISQMDEMELEKIMPMSKEMSDMGEMKPEKKGITIVKLQSSKTPEIELEDDSEEDNSMENDSEESIDPYSALARLKEKIKIKKGM